jgi:hypothetical protein
MKKSAIWSFDRRALSPIFATVLLATIIIVVGSVAFYFSTNLTTNATNGYVNSLAISQQSISERIGFENVIYNHTSNTLTVYIINSGNANNLKLNLLFLYDVNNNLVGNPVDLSSVTLRSIDGGAPVQGNLLNAGTEGFFSASASLTPGSVYTLHLVTKSGSAFDYEFSL